MQLLLSEQLRPSRLKRSRGNAAEHLPSGGAARLANADGSPAWRGRVGEPPASLPNGQAPGASILMCGSLYPGNAFWAFGTNWSASRRAAAAYVSAEDLIDSRRVASS